MPVRMLATTGKEADCTRAEAFIEGIEAEHLLAAEPGAGDGSGDTVESEPEDRAGV